jgi:vitamin K-dependent gamma-carboxylase-like protein
VRAWRAWVALWDRREDATALALVRIGVAVVLLYDFAQVWRLDLIDALWAAPPDGYAHPYDGWATRWLGRGPDAAFALWLAATASLVAIAAGALTPLACAVFVLVSAQLAHLGADGDRGIDMMLRLAVGILAFSRCNARWSIDAAVLRRLGRPIVREAPAWPRYLLMAQLVWIYFSAATNKSGAEWSPMGGFAALGNILSDPHFARFDPGWITVAHPVLRVATAATIAFELGAPIYLVLHYWAATPERGGWLRRVGARLRLRWIWLGTGAAFHLGIALTMTMGIFPWGMLALYPALLLPRDLRRLGAAGPPSPAPSPSQEVTNFPIGKKGR